MFRNTLKHIQKNFINDKWMTALTSQLVQLMNMKAHGWGFFSRSTVFTTLMETSDVLNKAGDMPINLFSQWHWTWTESEPNKHTRRLRWKMYMHHCLYYCVLSVSQTGLCVLALWSLINEKISHRPQLTHIWSFSLHQPPKLLFYVRDQPSVGGPTLLRCLSVHLGVQSVVTSYPSYANISYCCCLTLTSKMQRWSHFSIGAARQ